jgi:hypothetical protein
VSNDQHDKAQLNFVTGKIGDVDLRMFTYYTRMVSVTIMQELRRNGLKMKLNFIRGDGRHTDGLRKIYTEVATKTNLRLKCEPG